MKTLVCPADATLSAYLAGRVSAVELDEISRHVDECVVCLAKLECLPDATPFGVDVPPPDDPAYREAVSNLLELDRVLPPLTPGQILRDYQILEQIGEGGMGRVYKARHLRLEKIVALKVIRHGPRTDRAAKARFDREMKAVGRLSDPHIVQATDGGEIDGVQFLVMEYIEGQNLAALVKTGGPLPPAQAKDLIRQAALGLQHAHEAGLIHRDVKPSNLMLTPQGVVKILDLGLAVIAEDGVVDLGGTTSGGSGDLTGASRAVGTLAYMAPEQKRNAHQVDARADVYGLGGTLWYLLKGAAPNPNEKPPGAIPQDVWSKLLAEEPAERYGSAADVAVALAPRRAIWPLAIAAAVLLTITSLGIAAAVVPKNASSASPQPEVAEAPVQPVPAPAPVPEFKPVVIDAPLGGTIPMTTEHAQGIQKNWSGYLNKPVTMRDRFGTQYILIPPGGPFRVDAVSTATLTKPYYLGMTEVTCAEFARFASSTKEMFKTSVEISGKGSLIFGDPDKLNRSRSAPDLCWKNPGYLHQPDFPATYISYEDAMAYCDWLSEMTGKKVRLPTESEWKWAARAGTATRLYSGDDFNAAEPYEWFRNNSLMAPHAVAKRKPNPWGLFDMMGNVSEVTGEYTSQVQRLPGHLIDPKGPESGPFLVCCGGSYCSTATSPDPHVGVEVHTSIGRRVGTSRIGFRVLIEIP